jgi:hypothetical protein
VADSAEKESLVRARADGRHNGQGDVVVMTRSRIERRTRRQSRGSSDWG